MRSACCGSEPSSGSSESYEVVTNEVDQFGAPPLSATPPPQDSSSLVAEMQRLIDEPSGDDRGHSPASQSWQEFLEQLSSANNSLDTKRDTSDTRVDGEQRLSFPPRIGRFELRSIVGSGGFGIVFRAHDPQLNRDVALKILRPEAALSAR